MGLDLTCVRADVHFLRISLWLICVRIVAIFERGEILPPTVSERVYSQLFCLVLLQLQQCSARQDNTAGVYLNKHINTTFAPDLACTHKFLTSAGQAHNWQSTTFTQPEDKAVYLSFIWPDTGHVTNLPETGRVNRTAGARRQQKERWRLTRMLVFYLLLQSVFQTQHQQNDFGALLEGSLFLTFYTINTHDYCRVNWPGTIFR